MTTKVQLSLLPEEQWNLCPNCREPVPGFGNLPDDLRQELESLAQEDPGKAISRLRESGCSFGIAKYWTTHQKRFCKEVCTVPCPHCGKALRTPQARQCRFCGADWH